jgi:multidrug efflux pump subunit AcrA (membrane-fusion protein)
MTDLDTRVRGGPPASRPAATSAPSRRSHRRRLRLFNTVLVLALAGLVAAAYASVGNPPAPKAAPRTAPALKGVVQATVSATGNVVTPGDLAVNFTTGGKLVEVDVAVGDKVARGQVLARVDPAAAQDTLNTAQANLASAQARLLQLQNPLSAPEIAQANLTVMQAQAQVDSSNAAYANAQSTAQQNAITYQTAINQANATLATDQTQLSADQSQLATDQNDATNNANAQSAAQSVVDFDQAQVTADQYRQFNDGCTAGGGGGAGGGGSGGSGSTTSTTTSVCPSDAFTLQQDQARLSQDQSKLSEAKSAATASASAVTSDKAKITTDQNKITTDQNGLTNARNSQTAGILKDQQSIQTSGFALNNAQLSLQSALAANAVKAEPPKPGDLAAAEASITSAQASVDTAQKAVDDTTLTAPADGTVATINGQVGQTVSGGGAAGSSGATSSTGGAGGGAATTSATSNTFLTLTNLDMLEVKAGFSETDAAKVRVNQPATVSLSALPNQALAAHVASLDTTATVVSNVVTYNAVLVLDNTTPGVKPGMTAAVTVVTAERSGVVHVPTAAVRGTGANATVTVLKDGKETTTPVAVGLRGDDSVEILSGLAVNDQVVISSGTTATGSGTNTNTGRLPTGGGIGGAGGGGPGGGGVRVGGR